MKFAIMLALLAVSAWGQGSTTIGGDRTVRNLTVTGTCTGCGGGSTAPNCVSDPTTVCVMEPFAPGSNGNLLIGTYGWSTVGSPSIAQYSSPAANKRGGYQITSGVAANNTTDVELAGGSATSYFPRLSDATNWTALFKFTTPSSLTEYILEIGFDTVAGSTNILTLGSYLRYANSTGCDNTNHPNLSDTTWMFVSRDGSGTNAQTGPAIAASTTYWLRLRNTGTPGQVLASLKAEGGSFPADVTLSTNIPTAAVVPMFKQTICNTSSRILQQNWFSWVQTGLN